MTVDTGATINVSDVKTFDNKPQTKFLFKNMTTFAYNTQAPADFLGKFDAVIETEKRISVPTFYVMTCENCGNLMSLSWRINKLISKDSTLENTFQKHFKVFFGLEKQKREKVKLDIDKIKLAKVQTQRRIPYHLVLCRVFCLQIFLPFAIRISPMNCV